MKIIILNCENHLSSICVNQKNIMSAIKFENISKQYRLGLVSTNTLRHDLNRWWQTSIRGKEDPYMMIGEVNDRSHKGVSDYVWALKDINFKVEQGDVLGIIGKNGAGKSTLLKILSKLTAPTIGSIKAKGRIASLLEVGTGFHHELTGRENVYMNGAILGMRKSEIDRKLDEIIDFSGVERYIDTPVKRYSSGMMVRLGFAVAANLDPEILVVDEVLAVGDAEFQKKAIGKMQDISRGEGRTVLFVSHNMTAIKNLCKTGIILKNGSIHTQGDIETVIDEYILENENNVSLDLSSDIHREGNGIARIVDFYVTNLKNEKISILLTGNDLIFNFKIKSKIECQIDLGFSFFTPDGTMISNLYSSYQNNTFQIKEGYSLISCLVRDFSFCSPKIIVRAMLYTDGVLSDWPTTHLDLLNIEKSDYYGTGKLSSPNIQFLFKGEWNIQNYLK